MKHEVFHWCMQFHDHLLTVVQFKMAIMHHIPYPTYQSFPIYVLLCGGA